MGKFLKECFVTKVHHFDALEIWDRLKIGQQVSLEKKTDEDKDEIELTVSFKNVEYFAEFNGMLQHDVTQENVAGNVSLKRLFPKDLKNGYRIGNLSKEDSKLIIDVISCGHGDVFDARIAYLDEKNEENKRIKVVIYIKEKNKKVN